MTASALKPKKANRRRSLVKAISWRLVAMTVLGIVSYMITGDIAETGLITLVYNLIQIAVYFAHERLWERIEWGQPKSVIPPARELDPEEVEQVKAHLKELGYIEE